MMRWTAPFLLAIGALLLAAPAWADEPAAAPAADSPPAAPPPEAGAEARVPAEADAPKPPPKVDYRPIVGRLVADLGSDRFADRQKATEALAKLPPAAMEEILRAWKDAASPEVRARLQAGVEEVVIAHLAASGGASLGYVGIAFSATQTVEVAFDDGAANPQGRELLVAFITGIIEEGPAAAAGLKEGDQIVSAAGRSVADFASAEDLTKFLSGLTPGQEAAFRVIRGAEFVTLKVTIGNRLTRAPEPYRSQWRRQLLEAWWDARRQSAE